MNPLQLAIELTNRNEQEARRSQSEKSVSPMENVVWGDDAQVNMFLPVDGWNTRHWRRYFGMQFKLVYEHAYTGTAHTDRVALSKVLFRARMELKMSNAEVKEFIDWVAEHKMKIHKRTGKLFLLPLLMNYLPDYYNYVVHPRMIADESAKVKQRDLPIDNEDLRVEIARHIDKDVHGNIMHIEPRLYVQFGVPIMAQYLTQQEGLNHENVSSLIFKDMQRIITVDSQHVSQLGGKNSPRFERVIKNSIAWEPYPFSPFNWREGTLRKLAQFFAYDKEKWWREHLPLGVNAATCLKTLKSKKKGL